MEQINRIELIDSNVYPDMDILQAVLGKSFGAYCDLLKLFDENELTYEWRYYKDGKAWLCKVENKKKTIVWMSAWKGYMKATIYFPEKYIEELKNLKIDEEKKKEIMDTKNVGKSKPCIFEIRNKKILKELNVVMQFKLAAK